MAVKAQETPLPYGVMDSEFASDLAVRLLKLADLPYRGEDYEQILKKNLLPHEYNYLVEDSSAIDPEKLNNRINQAVQWLGKLPSINVSLAYTPSQSFWEEIIDWLDKNGPGSGKASLTTAPEIGGGVIIDYNGKTYDYSLRKAQ